MAVLWRPVVSFERVTTVGRVTEHHHITHFISTGGHVVA